MHDPLSTVDLFQSNRVPADTSQYHDKGLKYTKELYKNLFIKKMKNDKYKEKVKARLEDNYSIYKTDIDHVIEKIDSYQDANDLMAFCDVIKLIDMKGSYKLYNCS